MADIYSKKKRSNIMSKISGKETKPEIIVRKFLFSKGFRFRKNVEELPGKPDIVLTKYKAVIFIHGCFWHHHESCPKSKMPETRKEFWKKKIKDNVIRDQRYYSELKNAGWRIAIVWECMTKKSDKIQELIKDLTFWLKSENHFIIFE